MFFCDRCHYSFNITKDVASKQIGGKVNSALKNLFVKYRNGETPTERDLKRITNQNLHDYDEFEALLGKEKKVMLSWIKTVNKTFTKVGGATDNQIGSNEAFFICRSCNNSQPIEPGSIIYSKNFNATDAVEDEDYSYVIYDPSLSRTRNYICKNTKCETHTNTDIKEAVLTKNTNYQLVYVCTSCSTYWVSGYA